MSTKPTTAATPPAQPPHQPAPFGCRFIALAAAVSLFFGLGGAAAGSVLFKQTKTITTNGSVFTNPGNNSAPTQIATGSIPDVVKKTSSEVVSITGSSSTPSFFGSIQQKSGGTGFIITNDGLIATNRHVVENTGDLTVVTSDGRTYSAQLKSVDPALDFALIKIEGKNLPVSNLGNSDALAVGESVVAIGNALGEFSNTVTTGVISAKERTIQASDQVSSGTEQLEDLLQTDAAINPGNSGGPLLNLGGQVIGMNTAVAGDGAQGIGFAIPINQVKQAIDSYQKNGKIIRASLGVRFVTITPDYAKLQKLPVDYGALLTGGPATPAVLPGRAAAKAGLREGDIITAVGVDKIDAQHSLSGLIGKHTPGEEVELTFLRDSKSQRVKLKLDQR